MHKITTHLWFDTEAKEAAEFYTQTFKGSSIKTTTQISDTPSGSVDIVTIDLWGQEYTLISAGPLFKFNPSISFLVACATREEVDTLWKHLSTNGKALMELGEYPFSGRYGWIQDRYGLSWQLMYTDKHTAPQRITPTLMFVSNVYGKTEEAMNFYTSVFHKSHVDFIMRYEEGEEPDKAGTIKHASFTLENQHFNAMESAHTHGFTFNEAISLIINCKTQKEIDYYWEKLSADPKAEQCGWLKDKYGVSWQVVPTVMNEMFKSNDKKKLARVTQAFLQMKKFDIAELERVYNQK